MPIAPRSPGRDRTPIVQTDGHGRRASSRRRTRRRLVAGRARPGRGVTAAGPPAALRSDPLLSGATARRPSRCARRRRTPPPSPAATRSPRSVARSSSRPRRPTRFTLTGRRFTITAHVCPMANIRPYDPPGEQHHTVCWVQHGFGVAPSSKQPATTYLFGHSWAEDSLEVLNKLSAHLRPPRCCRPRQHDAGRRADVSRSPARRLPAHPAHRNRHADLPRARARGASARTRPGFITSLAGSSTCRTGCC